MRPSQRTNGVAQYDAAAAQQSQRRLALKEKATTKLGRRYHFVVFCILLQRRFRLINVLDFFFYSM